ncbi:FixH family protein [bacterium]|nr:FixH family protein [bacterium]
MKFTYAQKFVGGMIGILVIALAVDIGTIVAGARTDDGLVVEHYYKHGLNYDVQRAQRENRQGWQVVLDAPKTAQRAAQATVTLKDRENRPLDGATVTLQLFRPTKAGYDQRITLAHVGAGRFEAPVTVPLEGLWDATVEIQQGATRYDHRERLHLEAPGS